ncbi:hypothetical protein K431DRAFT_346761 [Polychaeton citri CBS 116435]|uniref:Myb-like domain-containing protein n=1 Tax=Polychaeton citri CBS 116435 TaxID=1314669 RepID=A0A9P4Q9H4_9PEZI|nr:hypothetical protein K431DRAFT_346761 [Polychaeton citri CBS 116435]
MEAIRGAVSVPTAAAPTQAGQRPQRRRATGPRGPRTSWSDQDVDTLVRARQGGMPYSEIVKQLTVPRSALSCRLHYHQVMKKADAAPAAAPSRARAPAVGPPRLPPLQPRLPPPPPPQLPLPPLAANLRQLAPMPLPPQAVMEPTFQQMLESEQLVLQYQRIQQEEQLLQQQQQQQQHHHHRCYHNHHHHEQLQLQQQALQERPPPYYQEGYQQAYDWEYWEPSPEGGDEGDKIDPALNFFQQ